jgi:hypothetical protein
MNNLLNLAMSIIPRVEFQVEKYAAKATNELGNVVATFSDAVTVQGCVQAVENSAYQDLGLEFGKNYIEAWAEIAMLGLDKQDTADRITYNGATYNVVKSTDWLNYNGWTSVIAVEDKNL